MPRLLITGDQGQLGQEFQRLISDYSSFDFEFPGGRSRLDITNKTVVQDYFERIKPQYCINCAAFTAVDKAESEIQQAEQINVLAVKHLAEACKQANTHLIHFSTDYVYHNQENTPFKETDATNPQSVYATTKLKGEFAALENNPATTIIRTSWVYSNFGHNFLKTMLRLGAQRDELSVVYDQIGSPTYAYDLANATLAIIQQIENGKVAPAKSFGIFNYSNEGIASWYDFALSIFEMANITCKVHPIETKDYPTPAKRPPYSVLNKSKIKSAFMLDIPHWRESLRRCLEVRE